MRKPTFRLSADALERCEKELLRALAQVMPRAMVGMLDGSLRIRNVEGSAFDERGFPSNALAGRHIEDIVPAPQWERLRGRFQAALDGERQRFTHVGDEGIVTSFLLSPIASDDGTVLGVLAIVQEGSAAGLEALEVEGGFRFAFEVSAIPSALISLDESQLGRFLGVNRALSEITGYDEATLLVRDYAVLRPPEHAEADREVLRRFAAGELEVRDQEQRWVRADGSYSWGRLTLSRVPDPGGPSRVALAQVEDVTRRRRAERELERRESLYRSIVGALHEGVLTVRGDATVVDANDAACRVLGLAREELVGEPAWLTNLDPRLPDGTPMTSDASPLRRAAELGRPVEDAEIRIRRADGAERYLSLDVQPLEAGEGDETPLVVASLRDVTDRKLDEIRARGLMESHRWAGRVRAALEEDRLLLYSQPIHDLESGDLVAEELLVRLVDESGQLIEPAQFLPAAEEFGLMAAIDRWVLTRAATLAALGRNVHVNLSAQSLGDPTLHGVVREVLGESAAPGANLTFEVTETAVMKNMGTAERLARRLRELGSTLALDDFGTGFGTLTYIKRLPAQVLKIDREFVRDLSTSEASRHVVETVVGLAERFGQRTIAEGVEDEETATALREMGVRSAQGYHFARPAPLRFDDALAS